MSSVELAPEELRNAVRDGDVPGAVRAFVAEHGTDALELACEGHIPLAGGRPRSIFYAVHLGHDALVRAMIEECSVELRGIATEARGILRGVDSACGGTLIRTSSPLANRSSIGMSLSRQAHSASV